VYLGKLYKCTTEITTGEAWDSTKWSLAILSDDVAELNNKLDEIDEAVDFVTMTSDIENEVINGVTVNSESDGTLKLYGISAEPRRFLCLNGQKRTAASTFSFQQTLDAGTYEISAYVSGYATTLYWDYTYTTFESSVQLIRTGNAPVKVTFTSPVMIGLHMARDWDFGTVDNPTYVRLRATKLTANDMIARADASATAASLLKTISASNITLTESNYLTYFPNGSFNDAPLNSIYGISINVPLTDGPDGDAWIGYGSHTSTGYNRGILLTFRQYGVNDTLYSGKTQMLIGYRANSDGYKPTFSYRTAIVSAGAYVWSDWSKFEENGYLHSGNRVISAGKMSESVSDLNDMPSNVVYQIDRNCDGSDADHTLLNHPCPGVSCIVSTMAFSYSTKHGMAQTVYALNGNIYWRYGYQDSVDDYRFTAWKRIATYIPDPPTTDGAYVLKCVVTNGTPTYSWVSA
jgi:hypothetical protein